MQQEKNDFNRAPLMSDKVFREAENKDTSPTSNHDFWKNFGMLILALLVIIIVLTYFFPIPNIPYSY